MNSFSATSLYWILTNVMIMTLETPNTLPNFKCKNITIKRSVSEKLLGVIIDNKFDFTEHFNTVCKKANLKLHALNSVSRFLSPEQYVLIINAYLKSLFNHFPLVRMFCYRLIMHNMNKIHERSLTFIIEKVQGWFSRSLEVLWWYIKPSKMYKLFINRSIQIYSWSFSWNNERSFL